MKCFIITVLLCCSLLGFSQTVFLEEQRSTISCQSKEETQAFRQKIKAMKQLYYAGKKDTVSSVQRDMAAHVLLSWPMRANSDFDFQYNYFNLQNYVDQLREGDEIQDYNCSGRTYDGHDASDINLFPFWWRMMDNSHVMAVAAAPGIILPGREFVHNDHNCSPVSGSNNITILHDDGTTTNYRHLKKNSLTTKADNERVERGEFLGFIGSSGRSSNPHLHFAVYDVNDDLVEPFFNFSTPTCNFISDDSWWENQRAYWEPQINRLMTHSAVPAIEFCPDDEKVYAKNQFSSGDIFYTGIAFMDGQDDDQATCRLIKPNGDQHSSWTVTLNGSASRKYAVDGHLLPSGNSGTWTFRVSYRSKVYEHYFTVGCISSQTLSGTISGNDGHIAGNLISSTAIHTGSAASRVLYQSANAIELKPGFEVRAGIHFKARIKSCNYSE